MWSGSNLKWLTLDWHYNLLLDLFKFTAINTDNPQGLSTHTKWLHILNASGIMYVSISL